jgi:uncharacterized membrane protein YccC
MASNRIALYLRSSAQGLHDELLALHLRGARAVLSLQTVGSVLLAVAAADALGLNDRWWVAISAYVVMRADWETSISRALQRIAGTIGGATLGALLGAWAAASVWRFAPLLGLIAGFGLYRAIGSSRSYGWVLATITALLVVSGAPTSANVQRLAVWRLVDVLVGTAACVVVAGLVHVVRREWLRRHPGVTLPPMPEAARKAAPTLVRTDWRMRRLRLLQSIQGAVTIVLLAIAAYYRQLPDFAQMLVTVVVVLLVPLPALLRKRGEQNVVLVRMAHRVMGCLLAAVIAIGLLPLIGNVPLLCMLVLAGGLWLASHVQAGNPATSYIGTQFGIALIIVFVQDQRWSTDVSAASLRLIGIIAGIVALAVVMMLITAVRRLAGIER